MSQLTPNPLAHPTFLKSPVNSILNTLCDDTFEHTSAHNLLDAYSTLSYRIKAVASSLASDCEGYLSLQILKKNAIPLGRCIQRDIRRAFADPPASNSHVASLGSISTPPIQTTNIPPEIINMARETAMLCQNALQLVSDIFFLPALFILFPQSVLQQLLNDVLVIARSSDLLSFDRDKIGSLAAWIFSTLRLPAPVMAANADQVQGWLNDLPSAPVIQPRAYDIIHNLLSRFPDTFFQRSAGLLPEILLRMVSSDASSRMNATIALAGYALSRLSIRSATTAPDTLAAVHDFIRSQLPRSRPGKTSQTLKLLPDYFALAAKGHSTSTDGLGPRWAITAICCLTVLSGPGIFIGTRPMKLVLDTVAGVARRGTTMGHLVACAWRCMIWAFLQIPSEEPADRRPSLQEGAFDVVKQDPRGGAGACLVAGLLYLARGTPTSHAVLDRNLCRALVTLKDLISHRSQAVYDHGLALLSRLTSGIGVSTELSTVSTDEEGWHPNDIVPKAFLSRHILKCDAKPFDAALEAAQRFDVSVVHSLTEAEIVDHWDSIAEIWTLAVEKELGAQGATFSLPDVLAQAWQALLLAQTQLTQEHGHLTADAEFTMKAVSALAHFLEWKKRSSAAETSNARDIHTQCCILRLCSQLFKIMRHVFSEAWLSMAAGSLLTSALQHTFDLSDDGVKTSWAELCSALVSVSAPVLMARLAVEDQEHGIIDLNRELWRLAARQWTSMTPTPNRDDSLDFLATPLKFWSMDEEEILVWTSVVDDVMSNAALAAERTLFLDELMQRVPEDAAVSKMLEVPAIVVHLLSRLQLNRRLEHPSRFLQVIDTLLSELYSDTPEHVSTALQLLKQLRPILSGSRADILVDVLSMLSESLALWIADKSELLLLEEYNDVVIPIYCDALLVLHNTSVTPEILDALAHFLYSAFVRMPHPCHGPIAFYEFWKHIHPSLKHMHVSYPDEIKTALNACRDAFGATSSQDHSFDTESHSGSQAEWVSPVKSESFTPKSVRAGVHDFEKTPTTGKPSPSLSPEVPYEGPASSRRLRSSARSSRTSPRTRHDKDAASSDFMPSSPSDAARARRMAARPTSRVAHEKTARSAERPLKRQRVDVSSRTPQTISPLSYANRSGSSRLSPGSKGEGARAVLRRHVDYGTPSAASISAKAKGKRVASRRSPSPPVRAADVEAPSSDDYDAWEAPMGDVQELSDSQPSNEDEDDSLLPSFMKGGARDAEDYEHIHSDDTMIFDDAILDINDLPTPRTLGKRARPASPVRMHTAPADLYPQHSPSPIARPTLHRAQTASAHLEGLRDVVDALSEDSSQLDVGEIAEAAELTNRLGALLTEKLTRKLRSDEGEGSSERGASERL
ncbi:hypothetical protein VTO73DRAFT_5584 [Trametes versicolor]